jgi:sRNA-binding regulator protein Hfq
MPATQIIQVQTTQAPRLWGVIAASVPARMGRASRHRRTRRMPKTSTIKSRCKAKTPMVIVLTDGEEVHGIIEWYDKACIKVNRNGAPNVMIYKPSIKYMYKEGEGKK